MPLFVGTVEFAMAFTKKADSRALRNTFIVFDLSSITSTVALKKESIS